MRVNIPSYVFFIFLINYILSQDIFLNRTYGEVIDGGNYGASPNIDEPIVFDLNKFNLDQEIYIKICGEFEHNYIEYFFF